jgi:hypothetical protein
MGVASVARGGNIMRVTDLDWDELQTLIREVVHEELRDLITDPDRGPELTDEIQGVVTITAPLTGMRWQSVNWMSPVPGGRSTTR